LAAKKAQTVEGFKFVHMAIETRNLATKMLEGFYSGTSGKEENINLLDDVYKIQQ